MPLFTTNVVAAVKVTTEPLTLDDSPVGLVPTATLVGVILLIPLYTTTSVVVEPANAASVDPAKVYDSFVRKTV